MTLSRIPNIKSKRILWATLLTLRVLLVISVVAYAIVECIEFNTNKEILHLTLFSMFFLVTNFQINVGRHKAVIKDDEKAERLFLLAMFALSSSLLELVDLALDQVMRGLSDPSMYGYRISLSIMESFLGFVAILMVYYSIDRFLVFIRAILNDLRNVSL